MENRKGYLQVEESLLLRQRKREGTFSGATYVEETIPAVFPFTNLRMGRGQGAR
jgi:hypothetical protein